VAIGTGKKDKKGNTIPIPVQVGDKILLDKYSGHEVTLDGEEFVIVNADDIIAIVE
jgi:chaperonin GroES